MVCAAYTCLSSIKLHDSHAHVLSTIYFAFGTVAFRRGMHGYVLIERGAGGDGKCGILKDPSYPHVKASKEMSI